MRAFIIEDQQLFREFLKELLEKRMGIKVVGYATDGSAAVAGVERKRPDLVLLDLLIPKLSGIRVAKQLKERELGGKIVAVSSEVDPKTVHQVMLLDLDGYVDKSDVTMEALEAGLNTVLQGGRFISPSVITVMQSLKKDPNSFQKLLTRREQEVLILIGAGESDAGIAQKLGLKGSSVPGYRRRLCIKLGCRNSIDLMRYATENGFWKPAFAKMKLLDSYHYSHDS